MQFLYPVPINNGSYPAYYREGAAGELVPDLRQVNNVPVTITHLPPGVATQIPALSYGEKQGIPISAPGDRWGWYPANRGQEAHRTSYIANKPPEIDDPAFLNVRPLMDFVPSRQP